MKKYILLGMVCLLGISCNGQKEETDGVDNKNEMIQDPKGSWKVDKEFDENGNLIKYDSIYSWSSNNNFKDISAIERDSLLASFKSKFHANFSQFKNDGFDDIFTQDSLFEKHFFNNDFFDSDFGNDYLDIDRIRKHMLEKQKDFLEKYQSQFYKEEGEN